MYMFNALQSQLTLPYGSNYRQYPKWQEFYQAQETTPEKTGDELADEFFNAFVSGEDNE